MHTNGHTTVWGTHRGLGRARDAKGWYEHLKEWWAAHNAIRREANLAALAGRWDAKREAVISCRTDAAADMMAAEHAFSTATILYALANS